LLLFRCDLDEPAEGDHYQDGFRVDVDLRMGDEAVQGRRSPWDNPRHTAPHHLFANALEMEETIDTFGEIWMRKRILNVVMRVVYIFSK